MFLRFGKGRQHAAKLYSEWFRKGHLDDLAAWVEPQAISLVNRMIEITDFSLPEMSRVEEEGEQPNFCSNSLMG